MTLATTPPLIDYVENGITLIHPVPFQFRALTDIVCTRIPAATGVESAPLVQGSDYSVTGGGGGTGTVTKVNGGTAGDTFRIKRFTDRSQPTDPAAHDSFPADVLEASLDRLTAVNQEQDERSDEIDADLQQFKADEIALHGRTVRVPTAETIPELPDAATRADHYLAFNSLGAPMLGFSVAALAAVAAAITFAKGDPGGNAMAVGAFTSLTGMTIAVGQDSIETTGYAARGDGGRARYVYDPAINAGYVTAHPGAAAITVNGRGYRLDEQLLHPSMFTGGGATGFLNAKAWADFVVRPMPFLKPVSRLIIPASYDLPAGFKDQVGGSKIVCDGKNWRFAYSRFNAVDFSLSEPYTTYFLSNLTGNDANNGLTSGAAFKTYDHLAAVVAALPLGSNVVVMSLDRFVGFQSAVNLFQTGFTGRHVKMIAAHASGKCMMPLMREDKNQAAFAWTAHGSGAWKATGVFGGTGFAGNLSSQFFFLSADTYGLYEPVVSAGQTSVSVGDTEMTSCWDGGTSTQYVHLRDGLKPDPFVNWIYCGGLSRQIRMDSGSLMFEGFEFYSGSNGVSQSALSFRTTVDAVTQSLATIAFKRCGFFGSSGNALGIFDQHNVITEDCYAGYCFVDLFNMHSNRLDADYGKNSTYYEDNARGHHAGYQGFAWGLAPNASCNGSTVHDDWNVARAGSRFEDIKDACFADVGGSDSANYGIRAPVNLTGTAGGTAYNSAICYEANAGEGTQRRMTLVGAAADYNSDSAAIQIAGNAADATIYVDAWQGDPHARLLARTVSNAGPSAGSIKALDGTLLYKAA